MTDIHIFPVKRSAPPKPPEKKPFNMADAGERERRFQELQRAANGTRANEWAEK